MHGSRGVESTVATFNESFLLAGGSGTCLNVVLSLWLYLIYWCVRLYVVRHHGGRYCGGSELYISRHRIWCYNEYAKWQRADGRGGRPPNDGPMEGQIRRRLWVTEQMLNQSPKSCNFTTYIFYIYIWKLIFKSIKLRSLIDIYKAKCLSMFFITWAMHGHICSLIRIKLCLVTRAEGSFRWTWGLGAKPLINKVDYIIVVQTSMSPVSDSIAGLVASLSDGGCVLLSSVYGRCLQSDKRVMNTRGYENSKLSRNFAGSYVKRML